MNKLKFLMNRCALLVFLGTMSSLSLAQSDSAMHALYPYVSFEKNHFTGVENSSSFDRYYMNFDRMMRYGIGQQSIIHFGGSHIQADIWSNLLRERLQNIDTNIQGGRGIVFPFKAAGTNRPYSYSVKETGSWEGHRSSYSKHNNTWGVSGITATTKGADVSLRFTFHESITPVKTRNAILFTNIEETDYKLDVDVGDSTIFVHTFSLGNGYQRLEFSQEVDSITLRFTKPASSNSELKFYGMVLNNGNPGVVYNSIGVNGSRFVSFQRCELFQEQLNYLNPDLVIMSIGTNDSSEPGYDSSEYKANFKAFLDQVRIANPNCAIMLTVPNDNYVRKKYHNDNLESVRSVIYELAIEYDAKVWDLYGIMGGAGSAKTWMNAGMMKTDLVHFTKEGYLLKGDLFYRAFLDDYLKWYSEQEPIWTE
jgi:lysophospholipase L1-like esterase